jgi:hypothetical protein
LEINLGAKVALQELVLQVQALRVPHLLHRHRLNQNQRGEDSSTCQLQQNPLLMITLLSRVLPPEVGVGTCFRAWL